MEKIANLSVAEAKALRLLERKRGADLDVLCTRLSLEERQARSLIDRLRRKGVPVERTAKATFHADHVEVEKPRAAKQPRSRKAAAWDGVNRRKSNRRHDQLPAQ